ncbi:MAG: M48 family metalloprotease [Phycisphaeraceae bacterium]|nr:M48 family metalloprotease [Phycisphaeraceae bacterium]
MNTRRLIVLTIAASLLAPLAGCVTNAATGRRQFNSLSRAEEIQLGTEAAPQLAAEYGGPMGNASLQAYVRRVGMSMVPGVEGDYASLPWEFTLLDSDVINAFALPGGKVFITRGLAEKLDDEAELAGVLGHEIGHVTAEHADKRITSQMIVAGIAIGVSVATQDEDSEFLRVGVPALVGVGGQGFLLKFGRDEELQADGLGMRYMSRAGYDPSGQLDVMRVLAAASQGPRQPEWASTHPHPESRIKAIQQKLNNRYKDVHGERYQNRYHNEFLSRITH